MATQDISQGAHLEQRLDKLIGQALQVNGSLGRIQGIRGKMGARGVQAFDRQDLLEELGGLEQVLCRLHGEMLQTAALLKEERS